MPKRILTFSVVFSLMLLSASFTNYRPTQTGKPAVSGKWYHVTGGHYYKDTDRKDLARWYEFSAGKKIKYSSCTDMCGCMRATQHGTYEWENDSTISVVYFKSEHELYGTEKYDKPKKATLVIKKIKAGGLSISKQ